MVPGRTQIEQKQLRTYAREREQQPRPALVMLLFENNYPYDLTSAGSSDLIAASGQRCIGDKAG